MAALWTLALCLNAPAFALDSDKDKPLDVKADHLEGGLQQELSVLTGNVHVTQGSIVGTGDKADIHQTDHQVTRVVMYGAPATFQQGLEQGGVMKGRAKNIDYDTTTKHAVLTGDAVVEHPSGEARGEHLTYDVDSGKITGNGEGSSDGQVHLRMLPQSKETKAAKDKTGESKDGDKAKDDAAKGKAKDKAAKKPADATQDPAKTTP
jgi:lipopolysaccharide export system protein LptA